MRKSNVHSSHLNDIWFGMGSGGSFFLQTNSLAVGLNIGGASNQRSKLNEVCMEFFKSLWVNLEEEENLSLFG